MPQPRKNVFITYHRGVKGRERAELLAGILNLINIPTVTGENLGGKRLSDGVPQLIESARLLVALLTPDIDTIEGMRQPSQWTLQEITWGGALDIPLLLVVEEGVEFNGGLLGDLEQIRFAPEDFAGALVRIVNQVQALISLDVCIPEDLPEPNLRDAVRLLILEARGYARKHLWSEVLRVSEEALRLDPSAAAAALNKGVALVYLGQLTSAERLFRQMLEDFAGSDDSLLAKVHHNLGLAEEVRDAGSLGFKSLRKQAKHWEKSLALDHKSVYTRASLVLCRVALAEAGEANALLMDSLIHRGFLKALRHVVETKGAVGHRLLNELPDWLYSVLFPARHTHPEDDIALDDQVFAQTVGSR